MEAQLKLKIDKKKIQLPDTIKSIGTYTITLKLYTNISAELLLKVEDHAG